MKQLATDISHFFRCLLHPILKPFHQNIFCCTLQGDCAVALLRRQLFYFTFGIYTGLKNKVRRHFSLNQQAELLRIFLNICKAVQIPLTRISQIFLFGKNCCNHAINLPAHFLKDILFTGIISVKGTTGHAGTIDDGSDGDFIEGHFIHQVHQGCLNALFGKAVGFSI